ncbi:MAG: hypothetical protein ACRC7R_05735, partial [Sarcina sp.]
NIGKSYTPTVNKEFYIITPEGLQPYIISPTPKKLPNKIIVDNNALIKEEVATIEFDSNNKKLIVFSTGLTPDSTSGNIIYFSFNLKDNNNQFIKASSVIASNDNANDFVKNLDAKPFEYNDILELEYLTPDNITITNFPMASQNYSPIANREYYKITAEGLKPYTPPPQPEPETKKLPNAIIISNNTLPKQTVATVEFDIDNNKLIVNSTGIIPDETSSYSSYFKLKLMDDNSKVLKIESFFASNENANAFKNKLNGTKFAFNYILHLEYEVPANITITNYPNTPENYTPNVRSESYIITPEGLKSKPAPPPFPPRPPSVFLSNEIMLRSKK